MSHRKQAVRWSLQQAANEFNYSRQTIKTRLMANEVEAGEDGCFSTQQIVAAVCGDLLFERIRKTRAEANLAELKLGQLNGELCQTSVVKTVIQNFMIAMRSVIMNEVADPHARRKLVEAVKSIPDEAFISHDEPGEVSAA